MSAVETLTQARDLIARPGGWTQGYYARAKRGYPIGALTSGATCWCAEGALLRAGASGCEWKFFPKEQVSGSLAFWNDKVGRTQAEVVAAFDRAIALAKAEHA